VCDRLTNGLRRNRWHLGVVEVERRASVCRRAKDTKSEVLEGLLSCRREAVGRVVDFLRQDHR
jgi:hypothetical protein